MFVFHVEHLTVTRAEKLMIIGVVQDFLPIINVVNKGILRQSPHQTQLKINALIGNI